MGMGQNLVPLVNLIFFLVLMDVHPPKDLYFIGIDLYHIIVIPMNYLSTVVVHFILG